VYLGLLVAIAAMIVDQLSKYIILKYVLIEYAAVIVAPFFAIVRAWNTGVSFSMFNNYGIKGVYMLSGVALIIVAMLLKWLKDEKNNVIRVALGLIIGGALGNVLDRIRLGAVFDFLDFHIGQYHWPAFNMADSFICVGAGIVIVYSLFGNKKKENK
jgi:signal peptidase II